MTRIALPEMRKAGYDPGLATGSLAAGGSIDILIPPSIILVHLCRDRRAIGAAPVRGRPHSRALC